MTGSRPVAVATGVLCALALLAGSASATRAIRIPGGPITKTVEAFTIRAFGGEVRITCRLTLRGRLNSVITKTTAGLLPEGRIGRINTAATEGCVTNFGFPAEVTFLVEPEAPFSLRYEAFLGGLPNITGLRFRKLAISFRVAEPLVMNNCLYRGMVDLLLTFPPVEGGGGVQFNPERFLVPNAVPLFAAIAGNCPEIVELNGAGRVTPAQAAVLVD